MGSGPTLNYCWEPQAEGREGMNEVKPVLGREWLSSVPSGEPFCMGLRVAILGTGYFPVFISG